MEKGGIPCRISSLLCASSPPVLSDRLTKAVCSRTFKVKLKGCASALRGSVAFSLRSRAGLDSQSLWTHLSATLAMPTSVRDFLQGIQPQQTKPGSVQRESRGTGSGELLIRAPERRQVSRRQPCFPRHSPNKSVKLTCLAEIANDKPPGLELVF